MVKDTYIHASSADVIVVGGGHAGVEAAMSAARLGAETMLITMAPESIGQMSCNPAIGGTAKGHVVREIDALGGVMARIIDETGIQFKMLNRSKGPAMWSPRAQADRRMYAAAARRTVESAERVSVVADLATEIIVESGAVVGIRGLSGCEYRCRKLIVCSGTFLRGLLHTGLETREGGRDGEPAANALSRSLAALGLRLGRLKTGTPPRVDGATLNYDAMAVQPGDKPPVFFSYNTPARVIEQVDCWLTHTNEQTHEALRSGFDRSPLFTGRIQGIGPRYCPSVEDKVARFPDRVSHQIFIEPEGLDTTEVYVNGFATSLPVDIQDRALRTIRGMEEARIVRYGYAVEYDFVYPQQLLPSLETKEVRGLYLAGQICGTSGYEEAAGQGLMAGINAARALNGAPPVILGRHEAYIGVMIDDLVTKGVEDPYRLFTSRAEHRLLLRQDNADIRLAERAREAGMIDEKEYERRMDRRKRIEGHVTAIGGVKVAPGQANPVLESIDSTPIKEAQRGTQLLKRPEVRLTHLETMVDCSFEGDADELHQAEIQVKYEGYLLRQEQAAARQADLGRREIPEDMDYDGVAALSAEAKEKLKAVRPVTVGQASRIPGITPADISVVSIAIEARRRNRANHAVVSR